MSSHAFDSFPLISDAKIKLCEFHREKSWNEWCRKVSHGVTEKQEEVKAMLRQVTHAKSVEEHENAHQRLKNSKVWQTTS